MQIPRIRTSTGPTLSIFGRKMAVRTLPREGAAKIKIKSVLKYSWAVSRTLPGPNFDQVLCAATRRFDSAECGPSARTMLDRLQAEAAQLGTFLLKPY
jgi:hypothetical protein